jgi:ribulose-phosphate 3-epimerase
MGGKIAPSIMCADLLHLARDIKALERAGVEYLHFDIMDGDFVPNFTLGPDLVKSVRRVTDVPFDIHLMIQRPEDHIDLFDLRPGDFVSIHQESTVHLQRTLQKIVDVGGRAAVALNPATSIYTIQDILDDVDMVLLMTVNPGFAGQKLIPSTLDKIRRLKKYLLDNGRNDIQIEVDGNVSLQSASMMRAAGADIFVAGTSSIFAEGIDIAQGVNKLRSCIE